MIWPLHYQARFLREKQQIIQLANEVRWLEVLRWHIDNDAHVCAEVDLHLDGLCREATLRYSKGFPHTAPTVLPRNPERWSDHQYGNQDLCLEFGPDNWDPSLTGADMLRSAHRLLAGEARTLLCPNPAPVPSRHELSVGQSLRHQVFRLIVTPSALAQVRTMEAVTRAQLRVFYYPGSANSVIAKVDLAEGTSWEDPALPSLPEGSTVSGWIVPSDVETELTSARALRALYVGTLEEHAAESTELLVIIRGNGSFSGFWLSNSDDRAWTIAVILPTGGERMAASSSPSLPISRVGLIGCGSIGSKVAAMLARSGVRRFLLVDDDIVRPENIVRNELSWGEVGAHKVDALERRLRSLQPQLDIKVRRQAVGGQEATSDADSVLSALAACDLIVDATANSTAFNYASAIAQTNKRPLVWGEVFGGGIGGFIARARPEHDPNPQLARAKLLNWFNTRPQPYPTANRPYEASAASGDAPLIADDADVSLVAAHLARFALDVLRDNTRSVFSSSAYVFSMRAGWEFEEPFETQPLDLGPAGESWVTEIVDDATQAAAIRELLRMFGVEEHESSSPP